MVLRHRGGPWCRWYRQRGGVDVQLSQSCLKLPPPRLNASVGIVHRVWADVAGSDDAKFERQPETHPADLRRDVPQGAEQRGGRQADIVEWVDQRGEQVGRSRTGIRFAAEVGGRRARDEDDVVPGDDADR